MRLFASVLAAALLFFALHPSFSFPAPLFSEQKERLPINIYADEVVWDEENQVITAQGFAHARRGDAFMAADYMEYSVSTGDLTARGNIVFEYEETRIFAQRMEFNVNTTLGVFYNADGYINGAYFITSKKVERLTETEYRLEDGSFTTCRCDNPAWSFTAREGALRTERSAILRGTTFRVKGLPVASLPIVLLPAKTERSTGFLFPTFGGSRLNGFTVDNRFFWAINEQSDATLGLDYLSKRGLRPNLEYRYIISENARGKIFGSALKDRVRDTTFYEVRGNHYQRFEGDVVAEAKVDQESAVSPARVFELDVERRAQVRTDSFLYVRKNWEQRALQMENRFFRGTTERKAPSFATLPELTFLNTRERFFNTPLYYDATLTGTNFMEELPGGGNRNLFRVDFFPKLTLPINSNSWWDFTQSVGFRETAYSDQVGSEKALSRQLFFSESTLEAPRLYRSFDVRLGQIDRIVHIIEPVVTYTYVSDNRADIREHILDFDDVDDFGAASTLSYGLTNRFITREMGKGGEMQVREVGRITLSQSYNIREARKLGGGSDPLSDLLMDVETQIFPWLRLNFDGLYNIKGDRLETMNFEVDYSFLGNLNLELDSRLKRGREPASVPRMDYIRAGIGAQLNKQWYLEYATRLDLLKDKVAENRFIMSYRSQCWGITAQLVERPDETRVDFQIELLGIGGIGEKIRRTVHPDVLPRL